MNRAWVYLVVLVCLCSFPVRGDVAAPAPTQDPDISATDKQAPDASLYKDEITSQIKSEVAKLADDSSSDVQGLARDWLIAQADGSDSYRALYATTLNQALKDMLASSTTTARARVNAGLVIAGIAANPAALNLLDATTALLADKSDGVVLPAEQAAGKLLALQLAAGGAGAKNLLAAMVQGAVAQANAPAGALITEEVYSDINPVLKNIPATNAAFSDIVDANLDLQKQRLALWQTAVPAAPYCDAYPAFVFDPAYWSSLNPTQQLQAMQNASDLISLASHYAIDSQAAQTLKSDLVQVITEEGDALERLASQVLQDQTMDQKMIPVKNLGVGSTPSAIKDATDPVYGALQQNSNFTKLTPPPNLDQK
jgi:hypothetical protein